METLKLYDKAKDGYLKVAIPKDFENKNLEIFVRIVKKEDSSKEENVNAKQRGKALSARFGKAKFKDYLIRKDDAYYQ